MVSWCGDGTVWCGVVVVGRVVWCGTCGGGGGGVRCHHGEFTSVAWVPFRFHGCVPICRGHAHAMEWMNLTDRRCGCGGEVWCGTVPSGGVVGCSAEWWWGAVSSRRVPALWVRFRFHSSRARAGDEICFVDGRWRRGSGLGWRDGVWCGVIIASSRPFRCGFGFVSICRGRAQAMERVWWAGVGRGGVA